MKTDAAPFFEEADDGLLVGSDPARGPWDADQCHAGPVAGLVARACERLAPAAQLVRLTLEVTRPVPLSGIRVSAREVRAGRTMTLTEATVALPSGEPLAIGRALHYAVRDLGDVPSPDPAPPDFDGRVPGRFPAPVAVHGQPFFLDGVDIAYPPGETTDPGPTTLWMRTVPLVAGEDPSPFQRLCPLADCGSGVARNAPLSDYTFMNPELTIYMHRASTAEWFASQAVAIWEPTGIGLATAVLHDPTGPVATVNQPLLLRPAA